MKIYISYVEQGENDHQHRSDIIDVEVGFYYNEESAMMQIKNWMDQKQSTLPAGRKLILVNKFEL